MLELPESGDMPKMTIRNEHFQSGLSRSAAADLFKESVGHVEVAISSYCNRKCSYCPDSIFDRKTTKHFMSDDIFLNIIRQLGEIDYSGSISLHRYNEPLADRNYALRRIRQIRTIAPNARIMIFSNGDFLDREYVQELMSAGVAHLMITSHALKHDSGFEIVKTRMERRLRKLGLPHHFHTATDLEYSATVKTGGRMTIAWSAYDFSSDRNRFDRGQTLASARFDRNEPCYIPFAELQIEWDGRVVPCCNIIVDNPEHRDYIVGAVGPDTDLFQTWTSDAMVSWRRTLFDYEPKSKPCATCQYGCFEDSDKLREFIGDIQRSLRAAPDESFKGD